MAPERLNEIPEERDDELNFTDEELEYMAEIQRENEERLKGKESGVESENTRKSNRRFGARVLAKVGFQDRHNEIVTSSLSKERARGEKFEGKNTVRRNEAYLERLDRIIDTYGDALEERLWTASKEKMIIRPEDIEDSYWRSQERALRDNGQGRELGLFDKQIMIDRIQRQQRESLESWADYLGNKDTPYPMWFKVYAWDGMSKMGVFDKDKQEFDKRDQHTVAPYPKLNAEVLAKVYGAVSDTGRSGVDKEDDGDGGEDDDEKKRLGALVGSGNFNRLYSWFLLRQKAIPKTPERTEDVYGEWVEYLPGQEEELASAAEGTTWCIADPGTAGGYLGSGVYDDYYDEEELSENQAKFILFHLEDPETGVLAENACASIRLDTDGNVAEVSGLGDGQTLEDALVPIVEEKVKTLPGGENFLEAFADKNRLIELDRKVQAGGKLTRDDIDFVFERERKIKSFNLHRQLVDPRILELRIEAIRAGEKVDKKDLREMLDEMSDGDVVKNFQRLQEIGADEKALMNKVMYYTRNSFGSALEGEKADVLWSIRERCGFDNIETVLRMLPCHTILENRNELQEAGFSMVELMSRKPERLAYYSEVYMDSEEVRRLAEEGVDVDVLSSGLSSDCVLRELWTFSDLGLSEKKILESLSHAILHLPDGDGSKWDSEYNKMAVKAVAVAHHRGISFNETVDAYATYLYTGEFVKHKALDMIEYLSSIFVQGDIEDELRNHVGGEEAKEFYEGVKHVYEMKERYSEE